MRRLAAAFAFFLLIAALPAHAGQVSCTCAPSAADCGTSRAYSTSADIPADKPQTCQFLCSGGGTTSDVECPTSGKNCQPGSTCLTNPLGTSSIPTVVGNVLKAMLGIMGSLALLMFIYGGFLWLTSAGHHDKVEQGRLVMVWAAIGLAVILTSAVLVRFVFGAFTSL